MTLPEANQILDDVKHNVRQHPEYIITHALIVTGDITTSLDYSHINVEGKGR